MGIKGKKRVSLTQETILKRITEFDIFMYYMPKNGWKINQPTNSPFRKDVHPSFTISNRYGNLNYIDFGDTNFRGDCFHFVKQLYTLPSLDATLRKIDVDFGLGISDRTFTDDYKKITAEYKQPESAGKRYSKIQVLPKKFTLDELAYWNQFHQDISDLKRENIYSVDKIFLNKKRFTIDDNDMTFGYYYEGFWKTYRPFQDKKKKWLPNNVPITYLDGKEDIKDCNIAFINKSKKDKMVIRKLLRSTCDVQNESSGCFSEENVKFLKDNSKHQILSFDSDVAGVKSSQQITKLFDFGYCNVPRQYLAENIKDWAALSTKDNGMKIIEDYLILKGIL